ncbi:MAG: hypothetical protein ACK4M7_06195, partial [Burkholderiales bacterium]
MKVAQYLRWGSLSKVVYAVLLMPSVAASIPGAAVASAPTVTPSILNHERVVVAKPQPPKHRQRIQTKV